MKEWVVGIDASTVSVAYVASYNDRRVLARKVMLPHVPERPLRAFEATCDFLQRLDTHPTAHIALVAIESPLLGRMNVQTTIKQAIVNGAIQAACHTFGPALLLVQPASWKKDVLGRGNLDKDGVRREIKARWPHLVGTVGEDQDLNDALAIYLWGLRVLTKAEGVLAQTQEAG